MREIFFFKTHAEDETGRLVPDLLFFKNAVYEVKATGLQLSFSIFQLPSTCHTIKTSYNILDYWSRDMLNFYFVEKGLGKVSPSYFV